MESKIICNYSVLNNSQVNDIYRNFRIMLSQKCDSISKQKSVLGGGDVLSLVSKSFISNINKIKDYEVTSRNTSLS